MRAITLCSILIVGSVFGSASMGCGAEPGAATDALSEEPSGSASSAMVLPGAHPFRGGSRLRAGGWLVKGEALTSGSGRFRAVYEGGGDFVVYDGETALWHAGTAGVPSDRLVFQGDCNVVIYAGRTPIWASHSQEQGLGELVMQDDGNLVVYTQTGFARWATATNVLP